MSGSGGSGGFGGFDLPDNCASIVIDTQLSSPKPEVIAGINIGDRLEVALSPLGTSTVVVVRSHGQVAGGLASPGVGRLRECLSQGTRYVALVTGKNEGQVQVRVQAA